MIDGNTKMARLTRTALLLAAALVCACGGGEDDDQDDGGDGTLETFTCSASLAPSTFDYVVSGDLLELSGAGFTETLERVETGDPERPVYGTWHLGEQTIPGGGVVSGYLLFEPAQISALADCDFGSVSASARAVSAAEISDATIVILESDEDVQIVTR